MSTRKRTDGGFVRVYQEVTIREYRVQGKWLFWIGSLARGFGCRTLKEIKFQIDDLQKRGSQV